MAQHQALWWFSDGYDSTAPWGKSFVQAPRFLQSAVPWQRSPSQAAIITKCTLCPCGHWVTSVWGSLWLGMVCFWLWLHGWCLCPAQIPLALGCLRRSLRCVRCLELSCLTAAAKLQRSPFQHKMTPLQAFGLRSNRKDVGLPAGYVLEVRSGEPCLGLRHQLRGVASPCLQLCLAASSASACLH